MAFENSLLSLITLTPAAVGLLLLVLAPRKAEAACRWIALLASLATLGLAGMAWLRFDATSPAFQLV